MTIAAAGEEEGGVVLDEGDSTRLHEAGAAWASLPPAVTAHPVTIDPDLSGVERRGEHGDRYVRVIRSNKQGFEKVAPGWLQATPRAGAPTTWRGRLGHRIRTSLIGAPLASSQLIHQRLSKVKALAVLSSDNLSSSAYATDQILTGLIGGGLAAYSFGIPVTMSIIALLAVVVFSYRQTIKAYPNGGGSYIVAKDNLGQTAGLIAASALMTDYVLTVAVSVASGVQYIASLVPAASGLEVPISVALVAAIAVGNLRGIRESGSIFAAPTYLFLFGILSTILIFMVRWATGHLPAATPALGHGPFEAVSIVLIGRAFALGCTALTGVEAVSDGVPAFRPPEWRNARTTLMIMGSLLGVIFLSMTILAVHMGLVPGATPMIAQLSERAFAGTWTVNGIVVGNAFVVVTTVMILVLAANTSFSDFPRLFYFLARDHYAPHQFARLGDKLAYSNGIVVLASLAIMLLVGFGAQVGALINLYCVGVFLAFTMSQAGMVRRWRTRREPGWRHGLAINAFGMVLTGFVFVVFAGFKFLEGAWIVIVIIPALVFTFRAIHAHYADVDRMVTSEIPTSPGDIRPVCLVPIRDLDAIALQSLALARTMGSNVIAIHVCDDDDHMARLRARWEAWGNHVPLVIIESPYRSFVRPLLAYIDAIDRQDDGDTLVVVLPELVATRWWHQVLHTQTALRLKAALLFRPGTVVINVPYHLRPRPARRGRHPGGADPDAI